MCLPMLCEVIDGWFVTCLINGGILWNSQVLLLDAVYLFLLPLGSWTGQDGDTCCMIVCCVMII